LLKKENWPEFLALPSGFSPELPGIEPTAKSPASCGNAEFDNVKRPADTPERIDAINMTNAAPTPGSVGERATASFLTIG
jgi:hypothetical protein